MRHQRKVKKLQRPSAQRKSLLSGLVCDLVAHKQIRTTLAKAKAVRPVAEKLVTLAKRGDLHARRQAVSFLRQKTIVKELFDVVAPASKNRAGGYTRITKLGQRLSDSAPMAFIEWVDQPGAGAGPAATEAPSAEAATAAPAKKTAARKASAKKAAKKKSGDGDEPASE